MALNSPSSAERALALPPPRLSGLLHCLSTREARVLRAVCTGAKSHIEAHPWEDLRTPVFSVQHWRSCFPAATGLRLSASRVWTPADAALLHGVAALNLAGLTDARSLAALTPLLLHGKRLILTELPPSFLCSALAAHPTALPFAAAAVKALAAPYSPRLTTAQASNLMTALTVLSDELPADTTAAIASSLIGLLYRHFYCFRGRHGLADACLTRVGAGTVVQAMVSALRRFPQNGELTFDISRLLSFLIDFRGGDNVQPLRAAFDAGGMRTALPALAAVMTRDPCGDLASNLVGIIYHFLVLAGPDVEATGIVPLFFPANLAALLAVIRAPPPINVCACTFLAEKLAMAVAVVPARAKGRARAVVYAGGIDAVLALVANHQHDEAGSLLALSLSLLVTLAAADPTLLIPYDAACRMFKELLALPTVRPSHLSSALQHLEVLLPRLPRDNSGGTGSEARFAFFSASHFVSALKRNSSTPSVVEAGCRVTIEACALSKKLTASLVSAGMRALLDAVAVAQPSLRTLASAAKSALASPGLRTLKPGPIPKLFNTLNAITMLAEVGHTPITLSEIQASTHLPEPAPLPRVLPPTMLAAPPTQRAVPCAVAAALDAIFAADATPAGCKAMAQALGSLCACVDAYPAATTSALWEVENILVLLVAASASHCGIVCACADGAAAPRRLIAALLDAVASSASTPAEVAAQLVAFEQPASATLAALAATPLPSFEAVVPMVAMLTTAIAAHPSVVAVCPSVAASPAILVASLPRFSKCPQAEVAGIAALMAYVKHLPATALAALPFWDAGARSGTPASPAVTQVCEVGRRSLHFCNVAAAVAQFLAACCAAGSASLRKAVSEAGVGLLADFLCRWPSSPEVVSPACDVLLALFHASAVDVLACDSVDAFSVASGVASALACSNPADGALLQKVLATLVAVERVKPGAFVESDRRLGCGTIAPFLLGAIEAFYESRPIVLHWGCYLLFCGVKPWWDIKLRALHGSPRLVLAAIRSMLVRSSNMATADPCKPCLSDTDPLVTSPLDFLRWPVVALNALVEHTVAEEMRVAGGISRPIGQLLEVSLRELGGAVAGVLRAGIQLGRDGHAVCKALDTLSEVCRLGPSACAGLFSTDALAALAACIRVPGFKLITRCTCLGMLREMARGEPASFCAAPGLGWAATLDTAVYALLHVSAEARTEAYTLPPDTTSADNEQPLHLLASLLEHVVPALGVTAVVAALEPRPVLEALLAAIVASRRNVKRQGVALLRWLLLHSEDARRFVVGHPDWAALEDQVAVETDGGCMLLAARVASASVAVKSLVESEAAQPSSMPATSITKRGSRGPSAIHVTVASASQPAPASSPEAGETPVLAALQAAAFAPPPDQAASAPAVPPASSESAPPAQAPALTPAAVDEATAAAVLAALKAVVPRISSARPAANEHALKDALEALTAFIGRCDVVRVATTVCAGVQDRCTFEAVSRLVLETGGVAALMCAFNAHHSCCAAAAGKALEVLTRCMPLPPRRGLAAGLLVNEVLDAPNDDMGVTYAPGAPAEPGAAAQHDGSYECVLAEALEADPLFKAARSATPVPYDAESSEHWAAAISAAPGGIKCLVSSLAIPSLTVKDGARICTLLAMLARSSTTAAIEIAAAGGVAALLTFARTQIRSGSRSSDDFLDAVSTPLIALAALDAVPTIWGDPAFFGLPVGSGVVCGLSVIGRCMLGDYTQPMAAGSAILERVASYSQAGAAAVLDAGALKVLMNDTPAGAMHPLAAGHIAHLLRALVPRAFVPDAPVAWRFIAARKTTVTPTTVAAFGMSCISHAQESHATPHGAVAFARSAGLQLLDALTFAVPAVLATATFAALPSPLHTATPIPLHVEGPAVDLSSYDRLVAALRRSAPRLPGVAAASTVLARAVLASTDNAAVAAPALPDEVLKALLHRHGEDARVKADLVVVAAAVANGGAPLPLPRILLPGGQLFIQKQPLKVITELKAAAAVLRSSRSPPAIPDAMRLLSQTVGTLGLKAFAASCLVLKAALDVLDAFSGFAEKHGPGELGRALWGVRALRPLLDVVASHSGACCGCGITALQVLLRAVGEPGPADACDDVLYGKGKLAWTLGGEEGAPWWQARASSSVTAAAMTAAAMLADVDDDAAPAPGRFVSTSRWAAAFLQVKGLPSLTLVLAAQAKKPEVVAPATTLLARLCASSPDAAAAAVAGSVLPALFSALAASKGAAAGLDLSVPAAVLPALAALDSVPGVWALPAWTAKSGGRPAGVTLVTDTAAGLGTARSLSTTGPASVEPTAAALAFLLRRLAEAAPVAGAVHPAAVPALSLGNAFIGFPRVLEQACRAVTALVPHALAPGAPVPAPSTTVLAAMYSLTLDNAVTIGCEALYLCLRVDDATAAAWRAAAAGVALLEAATRVAPAALASPAFAGEGTVVRVMLALLGKAHTTAHASTTRAAAAALARASDGAPSAIAAAVAASKFTSAMFLEVLERYRMQLLVLKDLVAVASLMASAGLADASWAEVHAAARLMLVEPAPRPAAASPTPDATVTLESGVVADADFNAALEATFADALAAIAASGGSAP